MTNYLLITLSPFNRTRVATTNPQHNPIMTSRMDKRRQKFSNTRRDEIQNDLLRDVSLLSRSDGNNKQLEALKADKRKQAELLEQIRKETNDHNIEHGLRKLREIIVSTINQRNETSFTEFAEQVYVISFEFFLRRKEWVKLGGIVLEFMQEHLPNLFTTGGFLEAYIVYLAHSDHNLPKAIDMMLQYTSIPNLQDLVYMGAIYNYQCAPPTQWFCTAQRYNLQEQHSHAYNILSLSGTITEMQDRCFNVVCKSYNQLSWEFFEEYWLASIPMAQTLKDRIESSYTVQKNTNGTQTILLKKPRTT